MDNTNMTADQKKEACNSILEKIKTVINAGIDEGKDKNLYPADLVMLAFNVYGSLVAEYNMTGSIEGMKEKVSSKDPSTETVGTGAVGTENNVIDFATVKNTKGQLH